MTIAAALAVAAIAAACGVAARARRAADVTRRALRKSSDDLERLARAFSRFAPQEVVDDISSRGLEEKAEKREVTILFADLTGFTAMSDRLDPAVVVEILNGYFREMSAAITAHHGHVSKFMGDGLMALFGAVVRNPWQARDATLAALAMREALGRYNETLRARSLPELSFGVGIHRGTVVAGILGSDALREFTVIGDAVNVAARIEGLTRLHGVDILMSGEVREALDRTFRLRELPPTPIKGKPVPIATWTVEGREPAAADGG